MRIRKLQYRHAKKGWIVQAYLIEDDKGQVEFRYNPLTWGRVGASHYQFVPVAGSNFARADVVVEGRRLNSSVKVRAFVNGREACTLVHVTEKDRKGVPLKIEIRDEDYGNYRARWADYEGQPNLLFISASHKSLKRYLGPGPKFEGQNSPVFRLLLAEIVAESVCRKLLLSEAQNYPWDFRLADLKDDPSIVDDVLARLHGKIRDFVADAHDVMLSEREVRSFA